MAQGFVYFIEEAGSNRVKIGFSIQPWKRLNNLKTAVAGDLVMLWVFAGTRADEQHFHWLFQNHRIRGEWFTLSAVIAGFRYYGLEPDNFLPPDRRRFEAAPIRATPKRIYPTVVDPEKYERDASGFVIRKSKRRGPTIAKPRKTKRRGGVKWSSEEYLAKSAGMTVAQYRKSKQDIRDEWERDHPGEVPYWRR